MEKKKETTTTATTKDRKRAKAKGLRGRVERYIQFPPGSTDTKETPSSPSKIQ